MHKSLSRNIGFEQSHIRGAPETNFRSKSGFCPKEGGSDPIPTF